MITIYHNPQCRKSRETLKLIEESGEDYEIVEYLKSPPSKDKLRELISKVNLPFEYFIRKNEAVYKEYFKDKNLSEEQWLDALVENPKLIERPIVEKGDEAVLGRPPENVKQLLD